MRLTFSEVSEWLQYTHVISTDISFHFKHKVHLFRKVTCHRVRVRSSRGVSWNLLTPWVGSEFQVSESYDRVRARSRTIAVLRWNDFCRAKKIWFIASWLTSGAVSTIESNNCFPLPNIWCLSRSLSVQDDILVYHMCIAWSDRREYQNIWLWSK